jgi:hypothetical protein
LHPHVLAWILSGGIQRIWKSSDQTVPALLTKQTVSKVGCHESEKESQNLEVKELLKNSQSQAHLIPMMDFQSRSLSY